jgi:dTDP-4-dehydrorhamnose 3,5-epimerase
MNVIAQQLPGMYLIWGEPYSDKRGVFRRHFCQQSLLQQGIQFEVKQGNISENPYAGTLRGFHFQLSPYAEQKILTVLSGSIWNVTVDLRPESPTYRQYQVLQLNAAERQSLLIPAGTANAFLTMSDNTLVHYYMSELFQPDSYRGFHYRDPDLAITWPQPVKLISDHDDNLPTLRSLGVFA